jgi:uncharacterized metal-binding protein
MPNGRTHDKISLITTPIIGTTCFYISNYDIKTTMIILISHMFASFMFNGDLDMNSKPYNRWWLFKMIWIPYQIMFHHRSYFTHGIIIGTIIRIIYVGIIPLIIFVCYKWDITILFNMIKSNITIIIYIFVGLELGNSVHTLSDKIF